MNKAKYVTVISKFNTEIAIVFSPLLSHDDFSYMKIVSGGFVDIESKKHIYCYDSPVSLKYVKSKGRRDAYLIKQSLFSH